MFEKDEGVGQGGGQGWGGLKGRPRIQHNFFFGRVQLPDCGWQNLICICCTKVKKMVV